MEKSTYNKLTKSLHTISFIVFLGFLLWTFYSPAFLGARKGVFNADFAMTIYVYFIVTFALLALNYLLKLFKR